MDEIDFDQGIGLALDAINQDRFALVCGAGLSMAKPSEIPSAWDVAQDVKQSYDALYGSERPPLSEDIEEQAEFFFAENQLETMFLRQLISPHTFSANPSRGHIAVADFLLTKAARIAVSTNVDALIEQAGASLNGNIAFGVDRHAVATVVPGQSPLLKIHGCWSSGLDQTVWAPSQIESGSQKTRIDECADWLGVHLLNRDLIIIGFFTDWDYLNSVLRRCLGAVNPSNVVVIDPSTTSALADKAPALFEVGEKCTQRFVHVRVSGDEFLNELRRKWSLAFFRQVLHQGHQSLVASGDPRADETLQEPPNLDDEALWKCRRDLEGVGPKEPCTMSKPPSEPMLGCAHLLLRIAGAEMDRQYWSLNGVRIRVLRASSQGLHEIEAKHGDALSPADAPDVTIAVGATDMNLKASIARSRAQGTIVRPKQNGFVTFETAREELGL